MGIHRSILLCRVCIDHLDLDMGLPLLTPVGLLDRTSLAACKVSVQEREAARS